MRVTMISNYLNHHMEPLSDYLYEQFGNEYCFVTTKKIDQERINLGWEEKSRCYVVYAAFDHGRVDDLMKNSDVVILGQVPFRYARMRMKTGKQTFCQFERILKEGDEIWHVLPRKLKYTLLYGNSANTYLLCNSAYAAADFNRIGLFCNQTYKWGYFPKRIEYENVDDLINAKNKNSILWAGRFINWKHPEIAIKVAGNLRKRGLDFELKMIGTGNLEEQMKQQVRQEHLEKYVVLPGRMNPEAVRRQMEQSELFLFTSDRNEGRGAVLNEAMNSACAVVANREIGSVPYLICDKENGFVYKENEIETLADLVAEVFQNRAKLRTIQKKAYETICNVWNAEIAGGRLIKFIADVNKKSGRQITFQSGPLSRAD